MQEARYNKKHSYIPASDSKSATRLDFSLRSSGAPLNYEKHEDDIIQPM